MTREFDVKLSVSISSEDYPPDKMQEFVKKLFKDWHYTSMITFVEVTSCEVAETKHLYDDDED